MAKQEGEYQIAIRFDEQQNCFIGILLQYQNTPDGLEWFNMQTKQNESYPLLSHDMLKGGWFKLLKP